MLDLSFLSNQILLEGWSFGCGECQFPYQGMMTLFLFPVLHDLAETKRGFSTNCLMVLASAAQTEFTFALLCIWKLVLNENPMTDEKLRGSLRTGQTRPFLVQHFASGLRSEYSNHSRLALAGSSCNWLQRCIRNLTTHFILLREKKPEECTGG
jgi:hypothetical protein